MRRDLKKIKRRALSSQRMRSCESSRDFSSYGKGESDEENDSEEKKREVPSGSHLKKIDKFCKKYAKLRLVIEEGKEENDSWGAVSQ